IHGNGLGRHRENDDVLRRRRRRRPDAGLHGDARRIGVDTRRRRTVGELRRVGFVRGRIRERHADDGAAAVTIRWLDNLGQDVRYAARLLRKSPGFTLAVVLTLAFGIGANTAVFSLTNALLLQRLPVRNPERLVLVADPTRGSDQPPGVPNLLP